MFSAVPLREVEINKNRTPTSITQLAVPASQALFLSLHGVLLIHSKHHVMSMCLSSSWLSPQHVSCLTSGLASACASNQPKSSEGAANCSRLPEVFLVCFSLWSPNKCSSTTQCKVNQDMHVSSARSPSLCVLSCACFSSTDSLLCLLQLNIPSRICLSLSPVSTSEKHSFMCLPQKNTIQHN